MQELNQSKSTTRKIVYSASSFLIGILLVTFGFWKTVLIALITAIGYYVGSSDNIESSIKTLINKFFPPSDKKVSYTSEDMDKLKKAIEKKEAVKNEIGKKEAIKIETDKKEPEKKEPKEKPEA